jgi:basic amino acid/polyamine antiporter, APA family
VPSRRRRQVELERVLGAPALFATVYGNVGSSIYYALGVTAVFALGLTPLVFVIAGLIFACTTMTYAEGTVRYPEAGGSSSFARHAFNETVSFGAAWAQMLNYVITISISAFFVPHYLSIFWEPLRTNPWDIVVGAGVIVLLVLLNILGIREAAGLNVTLAVIDFATQLLLVLLGFYLIFSPEILVDNIHWGTTPSWGNFLLAIPVGMIAYTGIETVSNLAEEARDPAKNVPRAYLLTAIAVFAIFFTLPAIALSALPVVEIDGQLTTLLALTPEDGGYQNDPVLGLVENLGLSGVLLDAIRIYVGVLAATILFIATNAGVIGASRITYAMASYRQLPEVFRRIHPRFKTPWIALVFFAGFVSILTLLPGKVDFLGTMYSFGAMLSFTIAHVSLVVLRVRRRDEELIFRGRPNLRIRGVEWPVFALVGGLATGVAWLVVVVQTPDTRIAGLSWLAIGFATYFAYRRWVVHEPMAATVKAPVAFGPALALEYRRLLVPVLPGRASDDALCAPRAWPPSAARRSRP